MSIANLREAGLAGITMRYEKGGAVQVYKYNDKEIEFGPMAPDAEIIAAFLTPPAIEGEKEHE